LSTDALKDWSKKNIDEIFSDDANEKLNPVARKISEKINELSSETMKFGILWRILSICMSLVFFNIYSRFVFVVFMGKEGFFSYDFFANGDLAREVFFGTSEIVIIILSLSMFGLAIPIFKIFLKKEFDWVLLAIFGAINLCMLGLLGIFFLKNETFAFYEKGSFIALEFFISVHIAGMLHWPAKRSFRNLLILQFLIFGFTAIAPNVITNALKMGLQVYGMGGDLFINVEGKEGENNSGKLVLLSPENIYMRGENAQEILTFSRGDMKKISIFSKEKISK